MTKYLSKKIKEKYSKEISHRNEERLKESEKRFRNIFTYSSVGVSLVALDGHWLDVNKALCRITGYSKKELLKEKFKDITHPDDKIKSLKTFQEILSGKTDHIHLEKRYINKNGNVVWVFLSAVLVRGNNRKPLYIVTHTEDITERKKSEEKIKENEEKYIGLFKNANDAIWLLDGNIFIDCNQRAVELFHCRNIKEIIGNSPLKFSPTLQPDGQESKKKAYQYIKKALMGHPQRFYWKHTTNDGREVDAEISLNRIKIKEKFFLQAIGRDITERKKAEEKLRESEYFFKESQKAALIGSYKTDFIKNTWESSEVLDNIFGIKKNYKRNVQGWLNLIYVEDQKMMDKYLGEDVMKNHHLFNKEYRIVRKSDGQVRWVLGLGKISLNKKHQVVSMTGTIQDITDRVEREKRLEQAKNDFLSLASHQFRTPLSATKWVLESLGDDENLTLKQKEKINSLVVSNERLINLVHDMLDVTKIESGKLVANKSMVDIKKVVDEILIFLQVLLDKNKKAIKVVFHPNSQEIFCDPSLISEILKNLLSNAIIYSLESSKDIVLEVRNRTKDYLFSVHNDGFINKAALGNIKKFDKFVRGAGASERQPEGSGLGLYITRNMVKASGGDFWCESSAKTGTNFIFTIPKKV
jgi:PAS domain S-box-containing protein